MPKIHARLSIEIEVTEDEFKKIVEESREDRDNDGCDDIPIPENLIERAKPCDWDDGGYIPGEWLEEDVYCHLQDAERAE